MTPRPPNPEVVLIRHAQSEWNREGRFTGWVDAPLSDLGRREAVAAGVLLGERGFRFDGMSVAEVEAFEIPTGAPIVCALSPKGELVGWCYLGAGGDERRVA